MVVFINGACAFRLTINRLTITHFKSKIGAYQPDLTGNRLSYIVRRTFPQRTVYFWLFLTEVARFPSSAHVRYLRTTYWSSRISKRRMHIQKSVSVGCRSALSQAKIKKFSKNQNLISKNRSQLLLSPTKIWGLSFLKKHFFQQDCFRIIIIINFMFSSKLFGKKS